MYFGGAVGGPGAPPALVKANKDKLEEVVRLNMAHQQLRRRNGLVRSLLRQAASLPMAALRAPPTGAFGRRRQGGGGRKEMSNILPGAVCISSFSFLFHPFIVGNAGGQ